MHSSWEPASADDASDIFFDTQSTIGSVRSSQGILTLNNSNTGAGSLGYPSLARQQQVPDTLVESVHES